MSYADELWEELQAAIENGTESAEISALAASADSAVQAILAAAIAMNAFIDALTDALDSESAEIGTQRRYLSLRSALDAADNVYYGERPIWEAFHVWENVRSRIVYEERAAAVALGYDLQQPMTDDDIPF